MQIAGIRIDERRLRDICQRWGVAELSMFGSAASGSASPESDIDMLYVFRPGKNVGWEIVDLEAELAEVFGRKVDLVPKRYLHPLIRDEVLLTAQVLYAA